MQYIHSVACFIKKETLHSTAYERLAMNETIEKALLVRLAHELKCPVCTNVFLDAPYCFLCGHSFCKTCGDRCIDISGECPLCRIKVTRRSVCAVPLLGNIAKSIRHEATTHQWTELATQFNFSPNPRVSEQVSKKESISRFSPNLSLPPTDQLSAPSYHCECAQRSLFQIYPNNGLPDDPSMFSTSSHTGNILLMSQQVMGLKARQAFELKVSSEEDQSDDDKRDTDLQGTSLLRSSSPSLLTRSQKDNVFPLNKENEVQVDTTRVDEHNMVERVETSSENHARNTVPTCALCQIRFENHEEFNAFFERLQVLGCLKHAVLNSSSKSTQISIESIFSKVEGPFHIKLKSSMAKNEFLAASTPPKKYHSDSHVTIFKHKLAWNTKSGYVDLYAHHFCLLWSSQVGVRNGNLTKCERALSKGCVTKCKVCGEFGATARCTVKGCTKYFHATCAHFSTQATCLTGENKYELKCLLHGEKC